MRAIVIGAGISGLACALRLAERGAAVTVLEQAGRVGGAIQGVARGGFLFELGPQSFQLTPSLTELIRATQLEDQVLRAPARAPRYVFSRGRLRKVPMGPGILASGELLGPGTRFRLLADLIGRSKPPEREESVAEFVRRKFGQELLDRLAGPMVSGVYAGDPERLGLRDAFGELHRWEAERGSVLRGAVSAMRSRAKRGESRQTLASLRRGNASLVEAVAARLGEHVRLGASAECARVSGAGPPSPPAWEIRFSGSGGAGSVAGEAVVMATPADVAARILESVSTPLVNLLAGIEYAPIAVIGNGYRREQVRTPLDGFGFLVARNEGRRMLGTVWQSSLFPGRAPHGGANLTSFLGGATDPSLVDLAPDAIAQIAEKELAGILGIDGLPVEQAVKIYRRALPQFNVGHRRVVERIRLEAARIPRLFFVGNYLDGPSLGTCVELGFRVAENVCEMISERGES